MNNIRPDITDIIHEAYLAHGTTAAAIQNVLLREKNIDPEIVSHILNTLDDLEFPREEAWIDPKIHNEVLDEKEYYKKGYYNLLEKNAKLQRYIENLESVKIN